MKSNVKQPKVLLLGNAIIKHQELQSLTHDGFNIKAAKENHEPEKLDFFGKFDLLLFNCSTNDTNYMAKLIKVCHYCKGIPIIVITDTLNAKYVIEAFREGVSDFCYAPSDKDALYDLIIIALQRFTTATHNPSVLEWVKNKLTTNASNELNIVAPTMREWLEHTPTEATKYKIYVRFFGTFKVWIDGKEVKIPSAPRVKTILAWFFYHNNSKYHRDRIAKFLWSDMDISSAKNNLSVNLSHARKVFADLLEDELICSTDECYLLNPQWVIGSDVAQYRRNMQDGKAAKCAGREDEALSFFQRMTNQTQLSFLEDQLREPWTDSIREEYKEKNNGVLEYIYNCQIRQGKHEEAIETLHLALQIDDCQEDVHFKIFNCYLALGKINLAQKQKAECQRILKDNMNINRLGKRWDMEHTQ